MYRNTPEQESGTVQAIHAMGLTKRYRPAAPPVLKDFDLTIKTGEFFGLLGPNGAGKTTILSILSGLQQPDSGTVHVHEMTYARQSRAIKEKIGIVPQELALYGRLTAKENLIFFGRLLGLGGRRLKEQIEKCLDIARLNERSGHLVDSFSGGMKRRLNLVIGLLNDPLLLFLDEPTVGIDTQSRHLIHNELQRLHRSGTTLLYTTHYMEEAQELCSNIAVLDHGRILLEGPPGQLLHGSDYHNLEELFLELTGNKLRDV